MPSIGPPDLLGPLYRSLQKPECRFYAIANVQLCEHGKRDVFHRLFRDTQMSTDFGIGPALADFGKDLKLTRG